jgi:thymidylate synthase ThyX
MVQMVMDDPVIPIHWGKNQSGMQASEEIPPELRREAIKAWRDGLDAVYEVSVKPLMEIGVHKQVINRLIEPWSYMTTVITGTEWSNFFELRCHPDAQPEIQAMATAIRDAIGASAPVSRYLHLPFVETTEWEEWPEWYSTQVAVGRLTRISYLNHFGVRDPEDDRRLHDRLLSAVPPHMSPFEHIAWADHGSGLWYANFRDWKSYRRRLEDGDISI